MTKTWFITGANRGLGAAIARAVLDAGHNVVATARNPAQIEAALGTSDRLLAVKLDVTKPEQAQAAVEEALARFGGLDVLVNNAGYGQLGWFESVTDEQVRAQFETNVFGAMNVTRAVLPHFRAQRTGYVFTISSMAGLVSVAGGTVYASSKFAVEGWMEGLSQELRPLGIKATVIEPGFFKTDFLDPSSLSYGTVEIADYAAQFAEFKAFHDTMNHNQVGDPAKLGAVLLQLAEMDEPPVRLAAGSDAVGWVVDKAEALRANAERLRDLSASTDSAPVTGSVRIPYGVADAGQTS